MTKYNIFEEFINELRSEAVTGEQGKIIMNIFRNFKSLPKEKVGNKFVTHFEVPNTNGIFEDRKAIDLVQDSAGNLVALRTETFTKDGTKLSALKVSPNNKSFTWFDRCNGARKSRAYNDILTRTLDYDFHGVNPI